MIKTEFSEKAIKHKLTVTLYKNSPLIFISSIFVSTILFWELSSIIEKKSLTYWYTAFFVVSLLRLGLWIWFSYTKFRKELLTLQYNLFLVGSCATAFLWGALGSFLMPNDLFHQAFILIFVNIIFAGAGLGLGSSYVVWACYVLIGFTPILGWQIIQILHGSQIFISIFIIMFLYVIYVLIMGRRYYTVLYRNIRLHLKNAELFNDLKHYTTQIEFLSQLESKLFSCTSEKEVYDIGIQFILKLLPHTSGAIFLLSSISHKLKAIQTWGSLIDHYQTFSSQKCLAIQYGHPSSPHEKTQCKHFPKDVEAYLCIPLKTPEKTYGTLSIARSSNTAFTPYHQTMMFRIANNITGAITRLELRDTLQAQATHDFLTGLYNKRYLNEFLKLEINRVKRKKIHLAILMLDIDHFKSVNDNYGHEGGDALLQEVGRILLKHTRNYDTACRYGGEEFVIIMSDSSLETAFKRAETIREDIEKLSVTNNNQIISHITISIGIAGFPDHGDTLDHVIEAADQALYQAKREGRNRVCIANSRPSH